MAHYQVRRPSPESNSIWQILDHLAASKQWQIEMLEKGQAESPLWTEPPGDKESWQASEGRWTIAFPILVIVITFMGGQLKSEKARFLQGDLILG